MGKDRALEAAEEAMKRGCITEEERAEIARLFFAV